MPPVDNHLLGLIECTERQNLVDLCEKAPLNLSDVLWTAGEATRHVYFPIEGFISLVALSEGSPDMEVGMVGREGMLSAHAVLGVTNTPVRAIVQGQGWALRLPMDMFQYQLNSSPSMKDVLDRYVSVLMSQLTTSVTCFRHHGLRPRLARWLLMSQDRARSNQFGMTHKFLAYMLGVRRVSVTLTAGLMQEEGLIEYSRGKLRVLDRAGLEKAACGCYATALQSYVGLLG